MKEKLTSIFTAKCPVCLKGDVYIVRNPYDLKHFDEMHEHCECCGHKYEAETGYWYGAMYVSYGLSVAISVAAFLLTYFSDLIFNLDINAFTYFGIIVAALLVFIPVTFRTSRLIWMNLFVSYDPQKVKACS